MSTPAPTRSKQHRLRAAVEKTIQPLLADLPDAQQDAYLKQVRIDLYDTDPEQKNFTLAPLSRIVTVISLSRAVYNHLPPTDMLVPYHKLWLRLSSAPQTYPDGGALFPHMLNPKFAADIRTLILTPTLPELLQHALTMHLYGLNLTTARAEPVQLSILRHMFDPENLLHKT